MVIITYTDKAMITRCYIREFNTQNYYFLYRGEEGFKQSLSDACIFNSRNDVIEFFNREEENSIFEGKDVEIVETFCF